MNLGMFLLELPTMYYEDRGLTSLGGSNICVKYYLKVPGLSLEECAPAAAQAGFLKTPWT